MKWLKLFLLLSLSLSLLFLLCRSLLPEDTPLYSVPINSIQTPAPPTVPLSLPSARRVLLFVDRDNVILVKYLQHLRIEFDICYSQRKCKLPALYLPAAHHFSVVIFSDSVYSSIPATLSSSLSIYCLSVRCSYLVISHGSSVTSSLLSSHVHRESTLNLSTLSSPVYHLTRPRISFSESHFSGNFACFIPQHPTYQPLLFVHSNDHKDCWAIIQDVGEMDSIQKVYFGISPSHWLSNLIFLDTLRYYGSNTGMSLERYLLVDIDDVFLAKTELKMRERDVNRIVESQNAISRIVPGFKYNLGYCGSFYETGDEATKQGDRMLIELAPRFSWFGHTWSHTQLHKLSEEAIIEIMKKDLEFSRSYNLSIEREQYAVTPHHSGIYPIHIPLYRAWSELGHVSVTSTEQYPTLWPHHLRRGFTFQSVKVLPRQVCGLYTQVNYFRDYKGGERAFYRSARGGSLFETLLYNPVSVFMTHFSNYAGDNLAQKLFEELTYFVNKWTQIKIVYKTPSQLANIYFRIFPEDTTPLWNLPCHTRHASRHADIYTGDINCRRTPAVILVGPQKSGSTALLSFLVNLPQLATSYKDTETFEEIQFFSNTTRYLYGPDWYQTRFPFPINTTLIEKSATYFDHTLSPNRISSLLPNSRIVIILRDPAERAFSWYQHQRAHNNPIAVNYRFSQILQANSTQLYVSDETVQAVDKLRHRCLDPGLYHKHILNWLSYFNADDILFVDGAVVSNTPLKAVSQVLNFANISFSETDLTESLRFDTKKGYFCPVDTVGKTNCLGPGKGRIYDPMSPEEITFLKMFYSSPNERLRELLLRLSRPLPDWLLNT